LLLASFEHAKAHQAYVGINTVLVANRHRKRAVHQLTLEVQWHLFRETTASSAAQRGLVSPQAEKESSMSTELDDRVRQGTRYWWIPLVTGVGWLVVAWLVLRLNQTSLTTVGVLIGVVLIAAGVNEAAIAAFVPGGWKVWHIIMAVIFLLGGLWGLIRPVDTFFALASVLGLVFILYGSFEIGRSLASRAINPFWWLGLIGGILLILLAFWVSGSDRVYALRQRAYLILFWVGFMALFRGIIQIMLAFGIRRAGHDTSAPD
jgi:uncharacterized membrane protein HdeD (DUF308 family)